MGSPDDGAGREKESWRCFRRERRELRFVVALSDGVRDAWSRLGCGLPAARASAAFDPSLCCGKIHHISPFACFIGRFASTFLHRFAGRTR